MSLNVLEIENQFKFMQELKLYCESYCGGWGFSNARQLTERIYLENGMW